MKIRRILTSIGLAGLLALCVAGCSLDHPEYHFNGKIGDEQVRFYEKTAFDPCHIFDKDYFLEVVKADGTEVKYGDTVSKDFKLESVKITVGDNTTIYNSSSSNPVVGDVLEKAQKDFDDYLTKITDIQTAPLNRD